MKKYENLDNIKKRIHTVEITLQSGEYKGKLRTKIGGNCFGLNILNCIDEDIIYNIDDYECINCHIELLEDDEDGNAWFKCILADEKGNTCEEENECIHFSRLIVGINIINCEIIEN